MTRETAKRKIEMLDSYLQRKADYGESDHEAMMMAIKALEQEPCEDAISRQEALDIYDDYNVAVENGELEAYRKHRKRLLKLSSVQPKPKTGHWIFKKFDEKSGISNSYWCSVCNHPMSQVYNNYCGHCGCRMVEPQESEESC